MTPWYRAANETDIASPALLVYPERIDENLRRMVEIAGRAERLRPHVKTHKLPELIAMQLARGISRFKCATLSELAMTLAAGAQDVLLAFQPVGPNLRALAELCVRHPGAKVSAIADDASALTALSGVFRSAPKPLEVLLDVDCGMHRTGVQPGSDAVALYRLIASLPGLVPGGIHGYDGHIHDSDLTARRVECDRAYAPLLELRRALESLDLHVPRLVVGGTPTFAIHAERDAVELSPGTSLLWDHGYGSNFPDLPFVPAATVLTRVVSRPAKHRLCLDLGYKAICSESPPPRVMLFGLEDARFVTHSEEHLVVETERASEVSVGSAFYGVPWHICPTVALHDQAVVVRQGSAEEVWTIAGRGRGERLSA